MRLSLSAGNVVKQSWDLPLRAAVEELLLTKGATSSGVRALVHLARSPMRQGA